MTMFVIGYDTESPACLAACRTIVAMHRKHQVPATFFVVGATLEANPHEYRALLDDPLFEVASHTYSHQMLRDHPWCGPCKGEESIREQIVRGVEVIENVFERDCAGLRAGCCFVDGLKGANIALRYAAEAGLKYVSTMAWGKDYSLPAPLNQPFNYAQDGYPHLWELPAHGWHENLLKDHNQWGPRRLTLWPPIMPEAIPAGFIKTPEEETAINRVFMEKAVREDLAFVSIPWHPWLLARFDPDMKMLDQTFCLARQMGLPCGTYGDLYKKIAAA